MSNLSDQQQQVNKHARDKVRLDLIYKEGDLKKIDHKMIEVEQALSKLKHDRARIDMEFAIEEKKLKDLANDKMQMQNELIKLKHEMNSIHF